MLERRQTMLLEDYGILAADEGHKDYNTTLRDRRLKKSGAIEELDVIKSNLQEALDDTYYN